MIPQQHSTEIEDAVNVHDSMPAQFSSCAASKRFTATKRHDLCDPKELHYTYFVEKSRRNWPHHSKTWKDDNSVRRLRCINEERCVRRGVSKKVSEVVATGMAFQLGKCEFRFDRMIGWYKGVRTNPSHRRAVQ